MSMPLIRIPSGLQTEYFCLGENCLVYLPELLKLAFPGLPPYLVADKNTWEAAGRDAEKILTDAGTELAGKYIFPGEDRLHPEYGYSKMLAEKFPEKCVPVAIGSGVINDLVKCGAALKDLAYCCVPTACSVDGFTAAGGSMVVDGSKMTVRCPAPRALCADTLILRTAPAAMFASGYADLLTKIPAGVDWVIADALGIEPIRKDVWDLIQGNIRRWISDKNDMLAVFDGLAATGYSMQMYHDSRPASGAEHLFSHIWEMERLTLNGEEVSHGFKVGIGLLISTRLMEFVIEHDFEELVPLMKDGLNREERIAEIDQLLVKGCYGTEAKTTALNKHLEGSTLAGRRELIRKVWDKMRKDMKERLIPYSEMVKILKDAGCPVMPAEIGLTREQCIHAVYAAQLIRSRYTVLDLLYELGLLDAAVGSLGM